jgi:glycosyltransferase involved in cell wall biosynthesis
VVDLPEEAILKRRGIALCTPADHSAKKRAILSRLPPGSSLVSPGVIQRKSIKKRGALIHRGCRIGQIFHLPCLHIPWLARPFAAAALLLHLYRHRHEYDNLLCYNTYAHTFLPAMVAAKLLKRRLFLDWEDDYRLLPGNYLTKWLWPLAKKHCAGGIAASENMLEPDMKSRWRVVEAYCDLGYAQEQEFNLTPGSRLFFGGTLDQVRGAHLLPELITALGKVCGEFKLDITGGGPLSKLVHGLVDERVTYHGYVTDEEMRGLIDRADFCLVLQDPRHGFSKGSFPSKIHAYARMKKRILILRQSSGCS